MLNARITGGSFEPQAEFQAFLAVLRVEGAVSSFVGIARPSTRGGVAITRLFLDHHPTLSQESVAAITAAAHGRFDVSAVKVVHRYGEIRPGDAIVFVAAASLHRRAAFEATDYMMDRLKTEAFFWKREETADGSRWIEPTESDHLERGRWTT